MLFRLNLQSFALVIYDLVLLIFTCIVATVQSICQLLLKPNKKPLTGEIVLVTGAAQGLGRELALEFARRGAQLVLWDLKEAELKQTFKDVKHFDDKVSYYVCDVSDEKTVHETGVKIFQNVGCVTILVNNAGIISAKDLCSFDRKQIRKQMEVNIMAHYWTILEFLPKMKELNHGHIVGISSFLGHMPLPNIVPYCCSKFAIRGLMEALSEEFRFYKRFNIQFTTVFPTYINTTLGNKAVVKYLWLTPKIEPSEVAQKIIDGVQRNQDHIFIPAYHEYLARIVNVFPRKVQQCFSDFADVRVKLELDEK